MGRFASMLLVGAMLNCSPPLKADGPEFQVFGDPEDLAFDHHVRQVLRRPLSAHFDETPLATVIAVLERQLGIPMTLDRKALDDGGIASDNPITFQCRGLPARDILKNICRRLDLTWIADRRYVLITTPEKASSQLITRIYPVADLVIVADSGDELTARFDYDSLMNLITTTIQPTTWDETGGPGSICPYFSSGSVALSQTRDVHEEVQKLLRALRAARDAQGLTVHDAALALQRHQQDHSQKIREFQSHAQAGQPVTYAPSVAVRGWQIPRRHE